MSILYSPSSCHFLLPRTSLIGKTLLIGSDGRHQTRTLTLHTEGDEAGFDVVSEGEDFVVFGTEVIVIDVVVPAFEMVEVAI